MEQKIHIVGPAGSGKTYAAGRLSELLDVPAYDLDQIFWSRSDQSYSQKADPAERDARLKAIIAKQTWIIEGVYTSWVSESLAAADSILLLDLGHRKCSWRIIRRFIRRKLGAVATNKKETFKGLISLLRWNRDYIENRVPEIKRSLAAYGQKVICAPSAEVAVQRVVEQIKIQGRTG
jgi:adenylate kinase family enzyme